MCCAGCDGATTAAAAADNGATTPTAANTPDAAYQCLMPRSVDLQVSGQQSSHWNYSTMHVGVGGVSSLGAKRKFDCLHSPAGPEDGLRRFRSFLIQPSRRPLLRADVAREQRAVESLLAKGRG